MKTFFWILGILLLILFLLPLLTFVFEIPFYLLAGWAIFPFTIARTYTVEPVAILVAVVAFALLVVLTHWIARWLYASITTSDETANPWKFRWTLSGVSIVVLLFGCGICLLVAIHEVGWLATSKEPIVTSSREVVYRIMSNNQVKQIGLGFYNYETVHKALPPTGTYTADGEQLHGWETALAPYTEHDEIRPNKNLPWNHPENDRYSKIVRKELINPGVGHEFDTDRDGYGLNHYSVNSRVMGPNRGTTLREATDGLSNTILGGEINAQFPPWARPNNSRDPASGLNHSPNGFGGPWKTPGANMLMMDSSVRFIRGDIDPQVLRALATPNGGEKTPENWDD